MASGQRIPVPVSRAIKSMDKCRDFLASQPFPQPMTVREIRNRYKFWKQKRVLDRMSSPELSSLIRLLGTLSVSEYGRPHNFPYIHPRASQMHESTFAPHWGFLEEIANDKCRLRYPLLPSDHYWVMRMYLARYLERVQTDLPSAEQMLAKAGKHYLSLCTTTPHPDVHGPYFDALSTSPSPGPVRLFVTSLVQALRANRHSDDAVTDAFFHLVLRCDHQLSVALKEELLQVVSTNVARRAKNPLRSAPGRGEIKAPDVNVLVAALESALFAPGALPDDLAMRWSTTVASRLYSSDTAVKVTVDVRWNCVVLLALARTRSTGGPSESVQPAYDPVQQAAIVEWRTVCLLAATENLFRWAESRGTPLGDDVVQGFSQVVRRVWREWTNVHPSVAPPRSLLITRIICASFLRLGGQFKDKALVEVCRDFCVAAGLWSVRETQPDTEAGLHLLAAEQLYASLVCGTFFERALVDLMVYTHHVRVLRAAVDTAVARYSLTDPEHAQEVAAWATSRAVQPTDTVVADVGVALARRGISGFLDRYMDDTRLTPDLRAKVASAHLQMYMRHGRRFFDPTDVVQRMESFFVLAAQLTSPKSFLVRLRATLLVLVRHQHASQVVKIVEDVAAQHSSWFSELFYTRLLRGLLAHRQFRLAQRTLSLCSSKHPENAERWASLVLFKLHRARAKRLVFKSLGQPQISRNSLLALARARARRSELTSAAIQTNAGSDDLRALRQAVHALVLKGRFAAAKQLFSAVRKRTSPATWTSIGNTILHGYILRRTVSNRRRLEMVIDTYREFREQHDFSPDHVTVNILLKAQLRSVEDLDARMARQLFDVLVRSGYPTGTSAATPASGVDLPPFGMDPSPVETVIVGQLEIPRVRAPLRYKSHVQPLYKMFVKAFYQRGDVAAARKVVGIIKTLQAQGWTSGRRV